MTVGEYRNNVFYAAPAVSQPDSSEIDGCVSDYIDNFHSTNGADAPINNEQLGEWESGAAKDIARTELST